jgi:xanthine dehydrogenase small subunit
VRAVVSSLALRRPSSLRDALQMMEDEPPLMPLAGCTDVYVSLHFASASARSYIDLWPIPELRGIGRDGPTLRIGALTTYSELIASALVRRRLPMLVAAAREIGGKQIQNRGTIGGNLANASPAGDSLPPLAAADAVVVLRSEDAERRVPIGEFFTGYRATVRRPDELIVAVEVPPVPGGQWFRKVGTRAAQAISKIVMAGIRDGGRARIALGSVAATVVRLPATEAALASGGIDAAVAALANEIKPIDDVRSTAEYRLTVAQNLLRKFWSETE